MTKVKRVATIAFGQGINVLVNFLFLPYMARALNYEDYATYGQVLLITAFTMALLSSGLSKVIYVYLAAKDADEKSFDSNLLVGFLIGFLGAVILALFSDSIGEYFENDKIGALLKIFAWSLPLQIAYQTSVSRFIFEKRVRSMVSLSIGANLLKISLVVISIQLFASLSLTFWSILLSISVQFILGLYLLKRKNAFQFDIKIGIKQLKEGFPLGIAGLFGIGIIYIDGLMVSKLIGVKEYAIYRNGAIEIPMISTFYTSIAAILLPEISTLFKQGEFKKIVELKRKSISVTAAITYPIMVFLLFNSEDIITGYLGEAYQASAIIFSIFNLTLLMRITSYRDVLISANKGRVILYYNMVVFILNFLLNIILIEYLGMKGAAISTVICLLIYAFALLKRNMKEIDSDLFEVLRLKTLFSILVFSLLVALLAKLVSGQIASLFVRLLVSATVFFSITYFALIKRNILPFELIKKLFKSK